MQNDPKENNKLAIDPEEHQELIETLNAKLNTLIETEIGDDFDQMHPHADEVTWSVDHFDP